MKVIFMLGAVLSSLVACTTVTEKAQEEVKVGLANPASEYCLQQGGQVHIKNEADGQVGYCHFADGRVIEEWALFRSKPTECIAEEAKKLVGQKAGSDADIQQKTQASTIRRVAPGQAMTMDYRSDRVTITIAPSSNIILQAHCG